MMLLLIDMGHILFMAWAYTHLKHCCISKVTILFLNSIYYWIFKIQVSKVVRILPEIDLN